MDLFFHKYIGKQGFLREIKLLVTTGTLIPFALGLFFKAREFFSEDNEAHSSPPKFSSTLLCHFQFPSNTMMLFMLFPSKKYGSLWHRSFSVMTAQPLQLELPDFLCLFVLVLVVGLVLGVLFWF